MTSDSIDGYGRALQSNIRLGQHRRSAVTDLSLQIQELRNSSSQIRVIHYGCESWYNVKDRPVAVSCIAIVDLQSKEQVSFSLTDHKEDNEKRLLEQFYKYIRETP